VDLATANGRDDTEPGDATGRYEITWFLDMKIPANLGVFPRASGDEDVASPRGAMSD
jgi:hypothetical protein